MREAPPHRGATAATRAVAVPTRAARTAVVPATVLISLLTGCGIADRAGETELAAAAEQLRRAVTTAAGSLEDAERALEGVTGVDGQAQAGVHSAVAKATAAIAEARAAVEHADAQVAGGTSAAVDRASASLAEAKAAVDAAADSAQGALRDTLRALSARLDRLAAELEPA